MEPILGYAAGLLTLINPCVLPVLPIVLASALQASPLGPLALAGGMSLSFVALGMVVSTAGYAVGLTPEVVSQIGAWLMLGFGLILLVPQVSARFAVATAGLSAGADRRVEAIERTGAQGQFLAGLLLGAVWSPCIGPTLGGAIALASQGDSLGQAGLTMAGFALGVSTAMLALAYGARSVVLRRQTAMRRMAVWARPALGAVFVLVGGGILLGWHHALEAWALDALPAWLIDFSVSI